LRLTKDDLAVVEAEVPSFRRYLMEMHCRIAASALVLIGTVAGCRAEKNATGEWFGPFMYWQLAADLERTSPW
jgi:hypothetical protein